MAFFRVNTVFMLLGGVRIKNFFLTGGREGTKKKVVLTYFVKKTFFAFAKLLSKVEKAFMLIPAYYVPCQARIAL